MIDEATREACALYALGLLEGEPLAALRERVEAGDTEVAAELDALERVVPMLGLAAPIAPPARDLKRRLFSRIGVDEFYFFHADEDGWDPTGIEGVETRDLFIDPHDRSSTRLVRLAPGAGPVPLDRAMGAGVFVVSGDLELAGTRLSAGDSHRPGPSARSARSASGGVLLTVRGGATPTAPVDATPVTRRVAEQPWQEMGDGVFVRPLGLGALPGRDATMVQLASGGVFPEHHHGGAEELFVLTGSCLCMDRTLEAGDYHRAPAGSDHGVTVSEHGCEAIVFTVV